MELFCDARIQFFKKEEEHSSGMHLINAATEGSTDPYPLMQKHCKRYELRPVVEQEKLLLGQSHSSLSQGAVHM